MRSCRFENACIAFASQEEHPNTLFFAGTIVLLEVERWYNGSIFAANVNIDTYTCYCFFLQDGCRHTESGVEMQSQEVVRELNKEIRRV